MSSAVKYCIVGYNYATSGSAGGIWSTVDINGLELLFFVREMRIVPVTPLLEMYILRKSKILSAVLYDKK